MSWTTPHTFVVNETTTAATLNASVSGDTNFLHSPPSAGITAAAPQNAGQWTVATGTTPSLLSGTGSGCVALWDTDSMTNVGGATPNQMTVNTAGVYEVSLNGQWDANATGAVRRVAIAVSGVYECGQMCENVSNVTVEQIVTALISLSAAATLQPWGAQNSGGTINLSPCTADGSHAMFTATWVSAG